MLFWTVLCLAVLCSQSLGADHTSVADEFNDALDEGLQSVRVLIQNIESHLPSAVNKAFDCEYIAPPTMVLLLYPWISSLGILH